MRKNHPKFIWDYLLEKYMNGKKSKKLGNIVQAKRDDGITAMAWKDKGDKPKLRLTNLKTKGRKIAL
jgi:hypothetical protein